LGLQVYTTTWLGILKITFKTFLPSDLKNRNVVLGRTCSRKYQEKNIGTEK
jgi:hypothetical protein